MSKLNKKQRLKIYNDWRNGNKSLSVIASEIKLNRSTLQYMVNLIDRHGIEIYDKSKELFTKEFKEKAIVRSLTGNNSINQLSLDLGLRSNGILYNWIREYKKNGYNVVIKKKGRHSVHESEEASQTSRKDLEKQIQQLKEENLKLRIVNAYVKKLNALDQKHHKK